MSVVPEAGAGGGGSGIGGLGAGIGSGLLEVAETPQRFVL